MNLLLHQHIGDAFNCDLGACRCLRLLSLFNLQGTQNWFNIGVQSYGLWMQSVVDTISNDDQTGLIAADDNQPRRRKFGGFDFWLGHYKLCRFVH